MKTSSAKAKGRALQNWVRDKVVSLVGLPASKVRCALMGESGADVKIDCDYLGRFPYGIECKNVEAVNVWAAFNQARSNTPEGAMPLLIIKKNRELPLAIVDAEYFIRLHHDNSLKDHYPICITKGSYRET